MRRAFVAMAAALAVACGSAGVASAAGITVCNAARSHLAFALGYVGAAGLESAGRYEIDPGQCAAFLNYVAAGPFYVYGGDPAGAMSWTGDGDGAAQQFCLSQAPHFIIRNSEYMKEGRLACPDDAAARFIQVPDEPRGAPMFTFTEESATNRP